MGQYRSFCIDPADIGLVQKTIDMYKFIKIRHKILIQCNGNYMEMKKINYMLEIDILRDSSQKNLGLSV